MPARDVPPAARPRYARLLAAGAALLVTLVAVLGGLGLLPVSPASADGHPAAAAAARRTSPAPGSGALALTGGDYSGAPAPSAAAGPSVGSTSAASPSGRSTRAPDGTTTRDDALPAASGSGRRVVFDMSAQRVWLVTAKGGTDEVRRTYLVSGSVTDNLHPGSYRVYSRSLHAVGVEDSGTMQYMVRFTHGANAAIGFHDIPVLDGHLVQTREQLGQAQSHGCIRQWRPDARALWSFAPVGTRVVVVA